MFIELVFLSAVYVNVILCRARSHHVFPLSCLVVCWLFYLYISFRCNTCIFSWDLLVSP